MTTQTLECPIGIAGLTLTANLYADGADAVALATGISLTAGANDVTNYFGTTTISGAVKVVILNGSTVFARGWAILPASGQGTLRDNRDANVGWLNLTAQTARDIGASVLLSAGTGTGQLDFTSGVVKANATQWLGGTIPAVNVTGVPKVDLVDWLGTAPLALSSQQVQSIVPDTQKVDLNTLKTQTITCAAGVTVSPFVGATGAAINGTNVNTLSGHDPGSTLMAASSYTAPDNASIGVAATQATAAASSASTAATNTSTLLSRLGTFTGTGVNTVLGFLKAMFSSAAATPSDMGGTGTAANDSLQAIRERGDAAWITGSGSGSGSCAVTVTAKDDSGNLLTGCTITALFNGTPSGNNTTGGTGTCVLNLNPASYSFVGTLLSGYSAGTTNHTVVGTTDAVLVVLVKLALTHSPTNFVTGYLVARVSGTPTPNIEHTLTASHSVKSGDSLAQTTIAVSDVNGLVQFVGLKPGVTYRISRAQGDSVTFIVSDDGSGFFAIPDPIG